MCLVPVRRVLRFIGLSPIFLCVVQGYLHNSLIVLIILEYVFLNELCLGSILEGHSFSDFLNLMSTVSSVPSIICVFDSVIVMGFFYDWKDYAFNTIKYRWRGRILLAIAVGIKLMFEIVEGSFRITLSIIQNKWFGCLYLRVYYSILLINNFVVKNLINYIKSLKPYKTHKNNLQIMNI